MTNQEKLLRAIGEIDDDLIKEVSTAYKHRFTPLTRGLTVAASVVLISATVFAASELFIPKAFDNKFDAFHNGGSGGSMAPDAETNIGGYAYVNSEDFLESDYGYIYNIVSVGDYSVSFNLSLNTDIEEDFAASITGRNYETGQSAICISSIPNETEHDTVLPIIITVNGEAADALPDKAGDYTVTFDFSAIAESDFTWSNEIFIYHFGRICFV